MNTTSHKTEPTLFERASQRVSLSPRLNQHYDTIFSDSWADDEEHLKWVLKTPVWEIEGWAETVEASNQ